MVVGMLSLKTNENKVVRDGKVARNSTVAREGKVVGGKTWQ